jgi:hypothetical protein
MTKEDGSTDAKQCPHCQRWCLKDAACDYIFACGLDTRDGFVMGSGCGRSWCWVCGKKYCSQYIDIVTGKKLSNAKDNHTPFCCKEEGGFDEKNYCSGGHNPHCGKRWDK